MGARKVIRFYVAIFLIFDLFYSALASDKLESKVVRWVLTTSDFKQVKVNGGPLKKAGFWEFPSVSQLETESADALIAAPNRFFMKLFPGTVVKWTGSVFQLTKGRVYIKNVSNDLVFQIIGLFKFPMKQGDLIVQHDSKSKKTNFEMVKSNQAIQIDSDDREMPAPEATRLTFIPEFVEGDMVYDFLLNNRKIPKMKMEKAELKNPVIMGMDLWRQPIKKLAETKKKANEIAKAEEGVFICKAPKGKLNECAFVKESQHCLRYSCTLSGTWSQRTEFTEGRFCPKNKTVKNCEWLSL